MKPTFLAPALLLAATLFAPPAQARAQGDAPMVAPGDLLRITVFRKPELSGEFEVRENGTLLHPLYGEVQVAGQSAAEVERRVRALLTRYEAEPSFVIEPMIRVTVGGEVRQPGVQTVRPSATTFQAVAQAGGVTERGRMNRVALYRDGQVRMLDLAAAGSGDARERLHSGDVLVVERRSTIFRDVLAPLASVAGAAVAVVNLLAK
ncbi:MAG TPA: polysaccharide biosynthesis/export family protein [Longimicrobiaceae bacterium]|nr:polysaccharide biosynthesis/export family protein [Longimicrobiaceae bacterium]